MVYRRPGLLIAIYSDIHANLEALEAVLADIDTRNVDLRICLGDIVGYGASPNECVERVRADARICVAGNHDWAAVGRISSSNFNAFARTAIEWTREVLSAESKEYLNALPLSVGMDHSFLVHASPKNPERWAYLATLEQATEAFAYFESRFCFVGHTHVPFTILMEKDGLPYYMGAEVAIKRKQRALVNIGSVGQPRDRDPRSSYALLQPEKNIINICRVAYDIEKAQRKMKRVHLPEYLITRLSIGR